MEKIILIITIICFLTSSFFLFAKLTGSTPFTILARIIGLLGTLLPIHYWINTYLN
jgi:small neutral amino acid transporter SnatA (MarC family)